MELFKLLGTVAIDNSGAERELDGTVSKAKDSESKLSATFKKIGAAVAAAFAVDKIKDFGLACIQASADTGAMESQFTQVFGDMEGEASGSLSKIAADAGIMENRMKSSYTKIAAFAKTAGMDTADSLDLANRAMIAVADSAAFYDRSLEDTTESLQSFLKGNFENDAALGLSATETTRNAAAMELYGQKFIDLSESQKQLTLLKMVEDANKLSGAIGQASRESDTWTNQTGNLKQAITDMQSELGKPILATAVGWVSKLATGITNLTKKFKSGNNPVKKFIDKVKSLKDWFGEVVSYTEEKFEPVFANLAEFGGKVQAAFGDIVDRLKAFTTSSGDAEGATGLLKDAISFLADAAGGVVDLFDILLPYVQEFFSALISHLPQVREVWSQIFGFLQTLYVDVVQPVFDAVLGAIDDIGISFDEVFTVICEVFSFVMTVLQETWEALGKPIFDSIMSVVGTVVGFFKARMPEIKKFVGDVFQDIKELWANHLKPCFEAIGDFIQNILAPAFNYVFNKLIAPYVDKCFEAIKTLWSKVLKPAFENITDFITNVFTGNWKGAWNAIKKFFCDLWDGMVEYIKVPLNMIIGFVNKMITAVCNGINFAIDAINELSFEIPDWIPKIGGKTFGFDLDRVTAPQIPELEEGGMLKAGQIGLLEGKGAEAVVPLERDTDALDLIASRIYSSPNAGNAETVSLLKKILIALENLKVYLDTGALVGGLTPALDASLGDMYSRKGRA